MGVSGCGYVGVCGFLPVRCVSAHVEITYTHVSHMRKATATECSVVSIDI